MNVAWKVVALAAHDIAGKGVANVGAARAALLLAAKMASGHSPQT